MEVMKKTKIFIHSWVPEDLKSKLDDIFDIDCHDASDEILSGKRLFNRVKDVEGLIAQGPIIDKDLLSFCPNLKIVSNVAVGVDNIDVLACTNKNVQVTNTPGINTQAVADMSMALFLSVVRRVPEGDKMVRAGKFVGNPYPLLWGGDLQNENLGIIGLGSIGKEVAKRAVPFGLNIKYFNRNRVSHTIESELKAEWMTLDDLLASSRYVIILCPLTDETRHLIKLKELKLLGSKGFLINIARGPIVKESDLVYALENKIISGCALDVYEFEPKYDTKLSKMDNVVLTPHAGSASVRARTGMVELAAKNIEKFFLNNEVINPVNKLK